MSLSSIVEKVGARLSEPSTHGSIAALLGIAIPLLPAPYSFIAMGVAGLFGFNGIRLAEKK